MQQLPIIDMSALHRLDDADAVKRVVREIRDACRLSGFFYVTGHGVSAALLAQLEAASEEFFALPLKAKMEIDMQRGGRAWRGYFPVGGELTSGKPDQKQGLYFGTELGDEDPRVVSNMPLHGKNQWPADVPHLQQLVLDYMATTANAAQILLQGIALSLDLESNYFLTNYTAEPTVLFRIFHYPATPADSAEDVWGVGEHTDYGLLTLLAQDQLGGLQVKSAGNWLEARPIKGTMICNIGDMLDRLTGGWYKSTPHRVRNVSGQGRLSFPLFFDPDFRASMKPLPNVANRGELTDEPRWDNANLDEFEGSYGDYLIGKVSKVFPSLSDQVVINS